MSTWFDSTGPEVGWIILSSFAILAWGIFVIRVIGLRSLSKMSTFDFIVTVALGSIVATTAATSTSLWHGALAFATLLGAQWILARARRSTSLSAVIDNDPLLLMDGTRVLEENMTRARVTDADLRAKLREANVTNVDQVLAVILETTGDVSVLHGDGPLDPTILDGVRRD